MTDFVVHRIIFYIIAFMQFFTMNESISSSISVIDFYTNLKFYYYADMAGCGNTRNRGWSVVINISCGN